jgi:hypothetical protein
MLNSLQLHFEIFSEISAKTSQKRFQEFQAIKMGIILVFRQDNPQKQNVTQGKSFPGKSNMQGPLVIPTP